MHHIQDARGKAQHCGSAKITKRPHGMNARVVGAPPAAAHGATAARGTEICKRAVASFIIAFALGSGT